MLFRESGRGTVPLIPAQAGIQTLLKANWVPAFAGTSGTIPAFRNPLRSLRPPLI